MTLRLLALVTVLAIAAAGCTDDDPISTTGGAPEDGPTTELTVVIDGGEFNGGSYTLSCRPDDPRIVPVVDGIDPGEACQRVQDEAVAQRLINGPEPDRICTEIYGGPQRATITGTIDGEPVQTEITRVNGCEIDTWDRLLAGVLPATIGIEAESD